MTSQDITARTVAQQIERHTRNLKCSTYTMRCTTCGQPIVKGEQYTLNRLTLPNGKTRTERTHLGTGPCIAPQGGGISTPVGRGEA